MSAIASKFYVVPSYQVRCKNSIIGDSVVLNASFEYSDKGKDLAERKAKQLQDINDEEQIQKLKKAK